MNVNVGPPIKSSPQRITDPVTPSIQDHQSGGSDTQSSTRPAESDYKQGPPFYGHLYSEDSRPISVQDLRMFAIEQLVNGPIPVEEFYQRVDDMVRYIQTGEKPDAAG